jgi:hypothetical protein
MYKEWLEEPPPVSHGAYPRASATGQRTVRIGRCWDTSPYRFFLMEQLPRGLMPTCQRPGI